MSVRRPDLPEDRAPTGPVIPLEAAQLCLDCEVIFAIAHDPGRAPAHCPRCRSRAYWPLRRWLDRPAPVDAEVPDVLCVIPAAEA